MFKQRGAKKTGLNILIIGCGKVGTALTRQLCKEGHDRSEEHTSELQSH